MGSAGRLRGRQMLAAEPGWTVELLQNGVTPEPSLRAPPVFAEYDLSAVRVSSAEPPGGPTMVETRLTVHGAGFASYGDGQLTCVLGASSPTLVEATLLDTQTILCIVPVQTRADDLTVRVSLNGGDPGTSSGDAVTFAYYVPPYLGSISPSKGGAGGGTLVTIVGVGFEALSPWSKVRKQYLRCAFGGSADVVEARSHTDTKVRLARTPLSNVYHRTCHAHSSTPLPHVCPPSCPGRLRHALGRRGRRRQFVA
jgi:hypothetical protein